MRPEWWAGALLLCGLQQPILAAVPEPADFRQENYDSEVPATLSGATRVTAIEVHRLMHEQDAVVIDVIPEHRKPDDLPEDQVWFPVEHQGVSGALWLPDTGYGVLSEVTMHYFTGHLQQASGGKTDQALVFYCRTDCWMSWNAAKRALGIGYTQVYWFADGIEDWMFEGFETEVLAPAEGQRQALR